MSGAKSDGLLTPEEEEELRRKPADARRGRGAAAKIAPQHFKIINTLAAPR
jgi:hypothetical protein